KTGKIGKPCSPHFGTTAFGRHLQGEQFLVLSLCFRGKWGLSNKVRKSHLRWQRGNNSSRQICCKSDLLTKYKRLLTKFDRKTRLASESRVRIRRLALFLGGARICRLSLALGVGLAFAAASPPAAPKAAPARPQAQVPNAASVDDPIGALLAQQARSSPHAADPVVIGLALSESEARTRFAVELSDPVDVRAYTLTNPNRVVIDMPEVLWRASDDARPSGRRAVRSYRYGLFRKGNFRFVIDLRTPVKVEPPQIVPPDGTSSFRLLIDLTPSTSEDFVAHAGWPQDAKPAPSAVASLPSSPIAAGTGRDVKRVVVIDAGHGGIDPGTHGQTGLQEK